MCRHGLLRDFRSSTTVAQGSESSFDDRSPRQPGVIGHSEHGGTPVIAYRIWASITASPSRLGPSPSKTASRPVRRSRHARSTQAFPRDRRPRPEQTTAGPLPSCRTRPTANNAPPRPAPMLDHLVKRSFEHPAPVLKRLTPHLDTTRSLDDN
jgi:hypothetical protein